MLCKFAEQLNIPVHSTRRSIDKATVTWVYLNMFPAFIELGTQIGPKKLIG